ncbi:forkhead box protein J1-like [Phalacrocorax aristotelis]|uniref:forkhead box protein J1-like n=1 Tax=Phalacrocorax aristotelis TaxID=126867 RepID=UPI003F4BC50D
MAEGWLRCLQAGKDGGPEGSVGDSDDLDDSLTSLMWLQDFSISACMGKSSCCPSDPDPQDCHSIPSSAAPCSPPAADPARMGMPHTPCKPISSPTLSTAHHPTAAHPQLMQDIDYKTNPHIKPPYSYATLICMAMEASQKPKITLSAIYKWITDNFCYFRHADPNWQNSIRHNLSWNKGFIKVPREKGERGKGGFWKLDPQYADRLKSGAFKKRRMPPVQIHPAVTDRAQQEAQSVASPTTSACASSNSLNVSVELQQLLKEFEEVTGDQNWNLADGKAGHKRKQPLPEQTAKAPRLSNPALLTQEEQTELASLKGSLDWEAILNTTLNGDFSTFGDLELTPPISPLTRDLDLMLHGHHIASPQGQEHVLTESNHDNLDFDETFMATAFLQHPWHQGANDYLSNSGNVEEVFELSDGSLPADVSDWSSLVSLL